MNPNKCHDFNLDCSWTAREYNCKTANPNCHFNKLFGYYICM